MSEFTFKNSYIGSYKDNYNKYEDDYSAYDYDEEDDYENDTDNNFSRLNFSRNQDFPFELANSFLKSNKIILISELFYLYDEEFGCYKSINEKDLKTEIREYLNKNFCVHNNMLNRNALGEVMEILKTTKDIQKNIDYFKSNQYYINFLNGTLDLEKMVLLEHSEEFKMDYYLNVNYNPEKKMYDSKYFKQFLEFYSNGDDKKTKQLKEFLFAIISEINLKKAFMLIGKSNTGKSTILRVIQNTIGDKYVSNISLHRLKKDFEVSNLQGKKVNICGELDDDNIDNTDIFKSITGGDDFSANVKHSNNIKLRNKAKLIFAGNRMPNLKNTTGAEGFHERLLFLIFNNQIKKNNKDFNFSEKLIE